MSSNRLAPSLWWTEHVLQRILSHSFCVWLSPADFGLPPCDFYYWLPCVIPTPPSNQFLQCHPRRPRRIALQQILDISLATMAGPDGVILSHCCLAAWMTKEKHNIARLVTIAGRRTTASDVINTKSICWPTVSHALHLQGLLSGKRLQLTWPQVPLYGSCAKKSMSMVET